MKKAINILRSEHPENRRKAKTKPLEVMMERPNPDAGKSIVVNVDFEDEFDETLDEIRREKLLPKKRIWLWKVDNYSHFDLEFKKNKRHTHQSMSFGTKALDELKSLVSMEWSHHNMETYKVKVPTGWMLLIPTELERVCLYDFKKMVLYLDAFQYGMGLPFNPFIKEIFNYFYIAPSQITPNSWRILRAFEAICFHVRSRPTASSLNYFFCIKRGVTE